MKALVAGCGVGGPAVALYLRRIGWDVEILEATQEPDPHAGAFLNVATNGLTVLRDLGLADRLMTDAHPCPELVMWSGGGKRLGVVPNGPAGDPARGSVVVRRGWLQQVLKDAAQEAGIPIAFGARLSAIEEDGASVVARTMDGREFVGDLLVGSDGIGSIARRYVDPAAPKPKYSGLISVGGYAGNTGLKPTPGEQHFVFGRRSFFGYLVRDDGTTYWFANVTKPEPDRTALRQISPEAWLDELKDLHRDDTAPVPQILAAATGVVGAYPVYDLQHVPQWSRGRVVCIGDAIHATSPSAGQGASLTLEDAQVLGRCLRDSSDVELALKTFHQLRHQRTEAVVAYAQKINKQKKTTSGRVSMAIRDALLPIFLRKAATDTTVNWLYDPGTRWDEQSAT
ncbi:NAD(P)/FAD-dependent oxidoreductase [Kribbella sp. NPDC056861]|uniref:FAD-dependent oxidoreductase n=1 Tax=Kribbella sp. NPDC056861 TaxID=3154857 RepID=UPI003429E7F1